MSAALQKALAVVEPRLNFGVWEKPLDLAFARFAVNTPRRVAAAMGQFLVEATPTFGALSENLDYSSALRLALIFPNEIADAAEAEPYVHNPVALANFVYANRNGNGDVASGDGWFFRGSGLIDITGRGPYTKLAGVMGMAVEDVPAWCRTPAGAAMSGCWYLAANGCLEMADEWELSKITRAVNGPGMEGAEERVAYSNEILGQLLGESGGL